MDNTAMVENGAELIGGGGWLPGGKIRLAGGLQAALEGFLVLGQEGTAEELLCLLLEGFYLRLRFRGKKGHEWSWRYEDIQQLTLLPGGIHILTYKDSKFRLGADVELRFTGRPPVEELYRQSRRAALWGIGISLGLGGAKLAGGLLGNSVALVSDVSALDPPISMTEVSCSAAAIPRCTKPPTAPSSIETKPAGPNRFA